MGHWRTARTIPGGNRQSSGPPLRTGTQCELPPLPRGSIAGSHFFERSEISQSSLDERELGACIFLCAFLGLIATVLVLGYCALQSFIP